MRVGVALEVLFLVALLDQSAELQRVAGDDLGQVVGGREAVVIGEDRVGAGRPELSLRPTEQRDRNVGTLFAELGIVSSPIWWHSSKMSDLVSQNCRIRRYKTGVRIEGRLK